MARDKRVFPRKKGYSKFRHRYIRKLLKDPEIEIHGKKVIYNEVDVDDLFFLEYWNPHGDVYTNRTEYLFGGYDSIEEANDYYYDNYSKYTKETIWN